MPQIDGPHAELQFVVVDFQKYRQRAVALVARTDPILHAMYRLVDALLDEDRYSDAAAALVAFYGEDAVSTAHRMKGLIENTNESKFMLNLIAKCHRQLNRPTV